MINLRLLARECRTTLLALAGAVALLATVSSDVDAGASVKTVAAGVRIDAREAKVDEILALLRDHGLRYRSSIALDRVVTGTYEGPLPQVLGRVLTNYDYVIRSERDSIEVMVFDLGSTGQGTAKTVVDQTKGTQTATSTESKRGEPAPGTSAKDAPASAARDVPATPNPSAASPPVGTSQPNASSVPAVARPPDAGPMMYSPGSMPMQSGGASEPGALPGSRPPPPTVATSSAPAASDPNARRPPGS